ncbi:MAG: hemolysin III family protein, partial [Pontimonas sp.]
MAVPFADGANEYHASEIKPRWRGWIHLGTFPLAVAAGIVLVVFAQGVAATLSSAVFALSSLALFGVSATYHRFTWPTRTKAILRRLDHSNIFFLI